MGSIVFYFTICASAVSIAQPWIGVLNGYLSILLGPQVLWWWAFEGTRHFYFIAAGTVAGLILTILRKKIDLKLLLNRQNLYLILWYAFTVLSYLFAPFTNVVADSRFFSPEEIFPIVSKAFIFYFISVLCIDSEKKFKYLCWVIIFVEIFYIAWINDRYLSGYFGRLSGPSALGFSQYGDENNFAVFFVIGLPFLYYTGINTPSKILKYLIWFVIPFGWHAIFLTGSRGGLLGVFIVTLLTFVRSRKKFLALIVVTALIIAFIFQGGDAIKGRLSNEYIDADASVTGRFDAWSAAIDMIIAYPVTGVGVSSFGAAFPSFSRKGSIEAHNTYLQIAAECGIFAFIAYLCFLVHTLKNLWLICPINKRIDENSFYHTMANALIVSWIGFIACAFFLSLQVFEPFFYLAILSNYCLTKEKQIR
jgi:putative inorganic carbon (hco3(-)) transporter